MTSMLSRLLFFAALCNMSSFAVSKVTVDPCPMLGSNSFMCISYI